MGLSGRSTFLIYNTAVTLAGVAAMFALVRAISVESPEMDERETAGISSVESSPQVDRLAFVHPGAFSQPEQAPGDLPLRPSIVPSSEAAWSWSTQIRPAQPAPPVASRFSSLSLPWQSARPGTAKPFYTLKKRLAEISPAASARLAARFEAAKVAWPPAQIALVAIKDEKILELHARTMGSAWHLVHRYRILAASGSTGPKLRQGDKQVPEGVYGISFLNPNGAYHVSLRVNYPNAFDLQMAAREGRKDLGGDIMIHGKNLSAGCLAMGDEVAEELFVLAAQTGLSNVKLVIAPTDFRQNGVTGIEPGRPEWLPKLYAEIATAMSEFKGPRSTGLLSFFMK